MKPSRAPIQAGCALHQTGRAHPRRSVRCCPETSSITTRCGSFWDQYFAADEALDTPNAATTIEIPICVARYGSTALPPNIETGPVWASLGTIPAAIRKSHGSIAASSPANDPNVPGAFGKYPNPHAAAMKMETRGFLAAVVDGSGVADPTGALIFRRAPARAEALRKSIRRSRAR